MLNILLEGWIEKREWVNHLDPDPQITTTMKTMFDISGIGAQQKKKKMAEKIRKKNIKMSNQCCFNHS